MSQRIAVFPGSFDPITIGHVNIVERSLGIFDKVYVALGVNSTKRSMFSTEQRMEWLKATFAQHAQVEAISFEGLTVDLCARVNAVTIIRGLRNSTDHGYERSIALMNRAIGGVDTIFLPAEPEHAHVSSSIIREMIANKADVSAFVPAVVRP